MGSILFDKINNLSASLRCMKPAKVSKYKTHIKQHERWQLKYTKHNKILFFITHSTNPKIIKNKICQKLWKLESLAVKSNTCTGTWFSVKSNNYNIGLKEVGVDHCMGIRATTNFTSYCTVESKHLHEWCM